MMKIPYKIVTVIEMLMMAIFVYGCGKGDVSGKYRHETNSGWEMELLKNGRGYIKSDVTQSFDYSFENNTLYISHMLGAAKGPVDDKVISFPKTNDVVGKAFSGKWFRYEPIEKLIIGKWEAQPDTNHQLTFEFRSDGTYSFTFAEVEGGNFRRVYDGKYSVPSESVLRMEMNKIREIRDSKEMISPPMEKIFDLDMSFAVNQMSLKEPNQKALNYVRVNK